MTPFHLVLVVLLAALCVSRAVQAYPSAYTVGQQYVPSALLVASDGGFLVGDYADRIIQFDSAGAELNVFTLTFSSNINVVDLAYGIDGAVIIADANSNQLVVLTADFAESAVISTADTCFGVAVDTVGNIYATQINSGNVTSFSAIGSVLASFTTALSSPYSIVVDRLGKIYVGGATANQRIAVFTSNGTCISNLTTATPNLGGIRGLALDAIGNLYASDIDNQRVVAFVVSTGAYSIIASLNANIFDIAISPLTGDLYLADHDNSRIQHIMTNGASIANYSWPQASFDFPCAVAVDNNNGNIYVSNCGNSNNVIQVSVNGTYIKTVISNVRAYGIAVDSAGYLITVDNFNRQILKVDPTNGTTVMSFGYDANNYYDYYGVDIDHTNSLIYACDASFNNFILVFAAGNGTLLYSFRPTQSFSGMLQCSVLVDQMSGNLYFSNGDNNVIQLAPNGTVLAVMNGSPNINGATGLMLDPITKYIYILVTAPSPAVYGFDFSNQTQISMATSVAGIPLIQPFGGFIDANNNVYVADGVIGNRLIFDFVRPIGLISPPAISSSAVYSSSVASSSLSSSPSLSISSSASSSPLSSSVSSSPVSSSVSSSPVSSSVSSSPASSSPVSSSSSALSSLLTSDSSIISSSTTSFLPASSSMANSSSSLLSWLSSSSVVFAFGCGLTDSSVISVGSKYVRLQLNVSLSTLSTTLGYSFGPTFVSALQSALGIPATPERIICISVRTHDDSTSNGGTSALSILNQTDIEFYILNNSATYTADILFASLIMDMQLDNSTAMQIFTTDMGANGIIKVVSGSVVEVVNTSYSTSTSDSNKDDVDGVSNGAIAAIIVCSLCGACTLFALAFVVVCRNEREINSTTQRQVAVYDATVPALYVSKVKSNTTPTRYATLSIAANSNIALEMASVPMAEQS